MGAALPPRAARGGPGGGPAAGARLAAPPRPGGRRARVRAPAVRARPRAARNRRAAARRRLAVTPQRPLGRTLALDLGPVAARARRPARRQRLRAGALAGRRCRGRPRRTGIVGLVVGDLWAVVLRLVAEAVAV